MGGGWGLGENNYAPCSVPNCHIATHTSIHRVTGLKDFMTMKNEKFKLEIPMPEHEKELDC